MPGKIPRAACQRNSAGRRSVLVRVAAALAGLAFLAGVYWVARQGWAEWELRKGTEEGASRAAELAPGNARYWAGRSDWGSPERVSDLERAVALNPYYSEAWIELGLIAEARGDPENAERHLLEAARVDRGFGPRWTLANYYYRRQDREKFWEWAGQALEMSSGDATALYRLCWLLEPDGEKILARAIPRNADHLARYLLFLVSERRLREAARTAGLVLEKGGGAHRGMLVNLCEQLVAAGELDEALAVWNGMVAHGLLAFSRLDPERGPWLTNGELAATPLSAGFDWRILTVEGVSIEGIGAGRGLRIRFSGRQPEQCELLVQYVPAGPGSCYRLEYEYETNGLPRESGLRWRISGAERRDPIVTGTEYLWREQEGAGMLRICVPPRTRLLKLSLRYDRAPGTTPIEGWLLLRRVRLNREAGGAPGVNS